MSRLVLTTVFVLAAMSPATAAELPASLLDPYVRMQVALAADKTDSLKQDAVDLATAAATLGAPAAKLANAARQLERAADLKAARAAFGEVSNALVAYAKATGSTNPAGVKTAFCPMANKSWLQKGETIQNPYYGTEMLECGEWRK
jgi:HPt (histidine-containing phosphotransfer) domain-containing protein